MIAIDVTHTSHCHANTGIQRVARRIVRELGVRGATLVYDHYSRRWRCPDSTERGLVDFPCGMPSHRKRSARWTWLQKLRGISVAAGVSTYRPVPEGIETLVVPEVFAPPRTSAAYAALREEKAVRLVGVFNDLIPLLLPEHTPKKNVASFEVYLEALRQFDAVAAISEFSRDSLLHYWKSKGLAHPPVTAIPLGVDVPTSTVRVGTDIPVVLCVGTIEGRKNHFALLRAAESLWSQGLIFELVIFGGANLETSTAALALIDELVASGRRLRWVRGGSDETMEREYARAAFTVYPSLMEGFGLPVLESLARGVPCVCSGRNAMAETARDGGCLVVGEPDAEALSKGILILLTNEDALASLRREAKARPIRTWGDYVRDLGVFVANIVPSGVKPSGR